MKKAEQKKKRFYDAPNALTRNLNSELRFFQFDGKKFEYIYLYDNALF